MGPHKIAATIARQRVVAELMSVANEDGREQKGDANGVGHNEHQCGDGICLVPIRVAVDRVVGAVKGLALVLGKLQDDSRLIFPTEDRY